LDVTAITFSDFTAVYLLEEAGGDTVADAAELELLDISDATRTTTELAIAQTNGFLPRACYSCDIYF